MKENYCLLMSEYNKQKWDKDVRDQVMKTEKYNVLNISSQVNRFL